MPIPFRQSIDRTFKSDRPVRVKIALGVFVTLCMTVVGLVRSPKPPDPKTEMPLIIGGLIFATACGGVISYLLHVKDRVKHRLARGERVNLLARAYLGMGIWSLVLWFPTIFITGIFFIIVSHEIYYSFTAKPAKFGPRAQTVNFKPVGPAK
jgi:hypothetical protein